MPEFLHIDYYLKLIKNYSKNTENDNITLDEFKYFMNLNHNKLFHNIGKIVCFKVAQSYTILYTITKIKP